MNKDSRTTIHIRWALFTVGQIRTPSISDKQGNNAVLDNTLQMIRGIFYDDNG